MALLASSVPYEIATLPFSNFSFFSSASASKSTVLSARVSSFPSASDFISLFGLNSNHANPLETTAPLTSTLSSIQTTLTSSDPPSILLSSWSPASRAVSPAISPQCTKTTTVTNLVIATVSIAEIITVNDCRDTPCQKYDITKEYRPPLKDMSLESFPLPCFGEKCFEQQLRDYEASLSNAVPKGFAPKHLVPPCLDEWCLHRYPLVPYHGDYPSDYDLKRLRHQRFPGQHYEYNIKPSYLPDFPEYPYRPTANPGPENYAYRSKHRLAPARYGGHPYIYPHRPPSSAIYHEYSCENTHNSVRYPPPRYHEFTYERGYSSRPAPRRDDFSPGFSHRNKGRYFSPAYEEFSYESKYTDSPIHLSSLIYDELYHENHPKLSPRALLVEEPINVKNAKDTTPSQIRTSKPVGAAFLHDEWRYAITPGKPKLDFPHSRDNLGKLVPSVLSRRHSEATDWKWTGQNRASSRETSEFGAAEGVKRLPGEEVERYETNSPSERKSWHGPFRDPQSTPIYPENLAACAKIPAPYPLGSFTGPCHPWENDRCNYCQHCECLGWEYDRCSKCWPIVKQDEPPNPVDYSVLKITAAEISENEE